MPTANTAAVSSTFLIDPNALWHALTGLTPPLVIDAWVADDLAMMPARLPTAITQSGLAVANWQAQPAGLPIVVYCQKGLKISQGAAAWLRANRADARVLGGGIEGWQAAGLPLLGTDAPPPHPTAWITALTPTLQSTVAAWMLRRFVDRNARVLAVEPSQIALVADRFGALPLPPPPAVLALLAPVPPVLGSLIDEFMASDAQVGRIFAGLRALHPTWEGYLSAAMPVLDALTASVAAGPSPAPAGSR